MKGHLTRVTKFEEAQSDNKAHMCKDLYHEGQHMALVGQTRGVVKLWRFFNQPSEDFAEEDHKVVVVLVCAWCTNHT